MSRLCLQLVSTALKCQNLLLPLVYCLYVAPDVINPFKPNKIKAFNKSFLLALPKSAWGMFSSPFWLKQTATLKWTVVSAVLTARRQSQRLRKNDAVVSALGLLQSLYGACIEQPKSWSKWSAPWANPTVLRAASTLKSISASHMADNFKARLLKSALTSPEAHEP